MNCSKHPRTHTHTADICAGLSENYEAPQPTCEDGWMETYEILSVSELINIPAFVSSASACLRELFIILKTFVNISSAHSRGIVESHCTISELQEYFECNFHCLEQSSEHGFFICFCFGSKYPCGAFDQASKEA